MTDAHTGTQPDPAATPPRPEPDGKDWTWTLQRRCPDCAFDATSVRRAAIPALVRDAASRWPDVLARPDATTRPAPTTWSPLEYACHVRDVHRVFAERLRLMLEVDRPTFANWDQDATAVAERYDRQDPDTVSAELAESGEELATAYSRVGHDEWTRTGRRSNGSTFTVETLGQYALHDLFHHVWDVRG